MWPGNNEVLLMRFGRTRGFRVRQTLQQTIFNRMTFNELAQIKEHFTGAPGGFIPP